MIRELLICTFYGAIKSHTWSRYTTSKSKREWKAPGCKHAQKKRVCMCVCVYCMYYTSTFHPYQWLHAYKVSSTRDQIIMSLDTISNKHWAKATYCGDHTKPPSTPRKHTMQFVAVSFLPHKPYVILLSLSPFPFSPLPLSSPSLSIRGWWLPSDKKVANSEVLDAKALGNEQIERCFLHSCHKQTVTMTHTYRYLYICSTYVVHM